MATTQDRQTSSTPQANKSMTSAADQRPSEERKQFRDERSDALGANRRTADRHGPARMGEPGREPNISDHEQIAERAYAKFKQRGEEHGHDREDWLEAEREAREGSRNNE
jgi:hypothetical protein